MADNTSLVQSYKEEINKQLGDADTMKSLLDTTFKGLSAPLAKRAMLEGLMRGFTFVDFLQKSVYAISYGGNYNLVTGIDHARKIGMRNGVVGRSAPSFTEDAEGKLESCTITIKRKIDDYVGDFTETVFLKEYTTGKNLWTSKPRTMLAKVAEMHALRAACPEDLAQYYSEEEMQAEMSGPVEPDFVDVSKWSESLEAATSLEDLGKRWIEVPGDAKKSLEGLKDQLKASFEDVQITPEEEIIPEGNEPPHGDS